MRKEINAIVRNYAMAHEGSYEKSWNHLYKFYNKVCHVNIKSRATKRKVRPLDCADLEILKILAENLFVA